MTTLNATHFSFSKVSFSNAVLQACQQQPMQAMQALQQLQSLLQGSSFAQGGAPISGNVLEGFSQPQAPAHHLPAPQLQHCGAPVGKGLTTSPEGWPAGSVQTAGGYTIVPEGKDAAWSIFAPGQKPTDTPNTRVWGDPHVHEKDGTKWDFTKNSDFVLPDGTRINAQTTSETGQSWSKGLTITNGADRVQIDGINSNTPKTGGITNDGYEWRAQHLASNPQRDNFYLGGSGDNVKWFKETAGKVHGEITGAKFDKGTNRYEQITDQNSQYWVDPNLRSPVGSAAWGNELRTSILDAMTKRGGAGMSQAMGAFFALDHAQTQLQQQFNGLFGGLGGSFGGFLPAFSSIQGLGNVMLAQMQLQLALSVTLAGGAPPAVAAQAPAQQRPPLDWYIDKFGGAARFGHADYFAAVKDGYTNAEILAWMQSKNFSPAIIGQELLAEVRAGNVNPNHITNGAGLHNYLGMGQFSN
ncbi:MAG: DUF1521 domain-containing protein [Myxococcota bacterium]